MGGGDLNLKKSWHPGTFKNIEFVYQREKAQEEENKKMLQLRKEKEEERLREQLQSVAEAAGRVKKKSSRLEWMYAASSNQDGAVDEDKEAYLLGRKRIDDLVQAPKETVVSYSKSNNAFYGFQANSDKDFQAKVREDPLLAIK
jgi:hypothetical protein